MVKHAGHYLYNMMQEGTSTDVTLVVQGEELKCHSLVASCQGGLLKDLLENKNLRKDIKIVIEDVSPRIVKMVLE